jgi:hypothetical protein
MNSQDEILNYVLKKENLLATLDIISRASEIRRAALQQFWEMLHSQLQQKTPRQFAKLRHMKWDFYPPHNDFEGQYTTLYYHDSRLPESAQSLRYCVHHRANESSFDITIGIMWWYKPEKAKSRLLQLPAVMKLCQRLNSQQFQFDKNSYWWLRGSHLFRENGVEDFLKRHASNPKQVEGKICAAFWHLVEDTYELVAEANRAIRRAKQK